MVWRIVLIVVVIADDKKVRYFAFQFAHGIVGRLPLGSHPASVHNVSYAYYHLDIQGSEIINGPLCLRGKSLGIILGVILCVRQDDD